MSVICPTITAENAHNYRDQIERVASFAKRIHLDFADGILAPVKLFALGQAWLPDGVQADLHLMYRKPDDCLEQAISLKPNLVILHAEASGNFAELAEKLHQSGIKAGVALLPETSVETIGPSLSTIDHVLVFSGDLGYFGGRADLSLLDKVLKLRQLKPGIEIGWDGGINDENAKKLSTGGVDVLNVGSFIQHAKEPQKAYATLELSIN
jgi:ribulose-phosphate 3-epimerase